MKGPLVQVDNLDDRKEIWCLLKRLSPTRRLRFLEWCCSQAKLKSGWQRPHIAPKTRALAQKARWDTAADERLHHEVWGDLWMLTNNFSFDLDKGLAKLVEMVRRK